MRGNRKKLGIELRKQFKGKCHWCRRMVKVKHVDQCDPLRATIDHLVPRSKGGKDGKSNMVLSSYQCNQAKANMPPEEFERLIAIPDELGSRGDE